MPEYCVANAAETEREAVIEITPEMIEAGTETYFRHPFADEPSCEQARALVSDIYRAMTAASSNRSKVP